MIPPEQRYRALRALHSENFHCCFYCGCIATGFDYAPPQQHWQYYRYRDAACDNLQIPACPECVNLLKDCSMGLLIQRQEFVHTKLAAKYKKAISVYLKWNADEVAQLDFSLSHSIEAGLKLGEESHRRSNFGGYAYEIDGSRAEHNALRSVEVVIFGERFATLKDALVRASKTYQTPQAKLVEALAKHDNNLEAVLMEIQANKEQARFRKELNAQCAAFAKKHNLSRRFVVNAVEHYLDKQDIAVAEALDKLYLERVQHYNSQNKP